MAYNGPLPEVVNAGGTGAATLTGVLTGNGTSAVTANAVTQHGVLIAGASNAVSSLGVAASSTVLQGSTGADPSFTATPSVTSITFGAGTALSNYVQGTWTPTIVGGTVAGTTTYTAQFGSYTTIGNLVFCQAIVTCSAATGTGDVVLGAFPFTILNQSAGGSVGALTIAAAITYPVGTTGATVYGIVNSTTAKIYCSGTASAGGFLQMANTPQNYQFSIIYQK